MDIVNSAMYIEDDRLYDYAAGVARQLKPHGECGGSACVKALRRAMADIKTVSAAVKKRYGDMAAPPAACEWLLDNRYMVQRESACAIDALERAKRLRQSSEGTMLLQLCRSLFKAGLGSISESRCRLFLDGFQSITVLRRGELEAFPAAMRAAAVLAIAEVCRDMQYAADTEKHAESFKALFTSLRLISVLDWEKLISAADVTSAVLCADPTGDYPDMDSGTKASYLRRIELLARRQGVEEHVYARSLIKAAKAEGKHVGFYLFPPRRDFSPLYIAANVLLTVFVSLLAAFLSRSAWAALLLLLPVSELVKGLIDYVLLHSVSPRRLFRMSTEKGVPSEGRTVCVISALVPNAEVAVKLCKRLEQLRHVCSREGRSLCFGLLADLPEADSQQSEGDAEILSAARAGVNALNMKYGGGFYLFTRPRRFDGQRWTAWERKRGAIIQLARLLCSEQSELNVTGDKDALSGVRYILTLDSDTRVFPGAAGELIGAMLHPMNAPVIDEKRRVVTEGHALIHPRIDNELASANATDFALIFAGGGGSDPYGGLCGELYMDAFQSGGFAGKGIIDASALLKCADSRFPEGRILSHDALEGACLRGAYMSDAEFSDAFPAKPLPYFKRQHRWIRGDWQNLPWIFCAELAPIERFRLFDSIRRSLLPPMTLIAIVAGFFIPHGGLALAAWAALLSLLSRLIISLAEGARERREGARLRRHTRILTGVGGAIVHTFIRLWLLPYEAWICLTAAASSLWRMTVSRKNLLQWQTAAQSELGSTGLSNHIAAMWPAVALGLGLMLLAPAIIGRAAGFMWLLSPVTAAALALPAFKENSLSAADREFIVKAAGESFRYFTEFSSAEDNFLPPDNFQEQPPVGLAHRTSPTNIGLAMAAAVAAADMGHISAAEAAAYIGRVTDTLERMPRCIGHYYNWYDTRDLRPLSPAFVSTVDSGNLYSGLVTCRQALEEWGENELSERLGAIMAQMDFAPLYDSGRGLFYICYDGVQGRGSGGWYDLMASEAMLTSYIAIAKGDVPIKHWRRLSRAQLQKDGYRGLASWTGTMFEYLMPELFLPFYRGSLLYESGRFCLYAQKRRAFAGKPWGISESAFYSLDGALNYRYKANGCAALALKRGQDSDMVISPYSSFLALALDPHGAAKNLRRLESFGAAGRFGFMEALDFTPARCRRDAGEKVRCYMAHHIGMSVISAANAACEGSVRRRFMADAQMGAFSLLLQERIGGAAVIRRDNSEPPEKPPRSGEDFWRIRGGAEDSGTHYCLLTNGAYSILASSRGESCAMLGDTLIYGRRRSPMPCGLEVRVSMGGKELSIAELPLSLWELSEEDCVLEGEYEGLHIRQRLFAAAGEWGEKRIIRLRAKQDISFTLSLSFFPVLASAADYEGHPAYWRLGMESEIEGGSLLLRRLRRGDKRELWLCLACSEAAELSAQRFGGGGSLSDPYIRASVSAALAAGDALELSFALCLGYTREAALSGAEHILSGADSGNLTGAAAVHLNMTGAELSAAMDYLPYLIAPVINAPPRRELWQYGISGDLPIIACDLDERAAADALRRFCLIKSCGMDCELVYLSSESGEYRQPRRSMITELLSAVGLEALIGARGGVSFLPKSAAALIKSRAALLVGAPRELAPPLSMPRLSAERSGDSIPVHSRQGREQVFSVNNDLPPRAWQLILSNGSFGAAMAECGAGFMWLDNAREMRLTMPPEDIRFTQSSEALWANIGGKSLSLFAANDGIPCAVRFGAGYARWEKAIAGRSVSLSVFVPFGIDARVYYIEGAAGLNLCWALQPVLGGGDPSSLRCGFERGVFRARNGEAYLPKAELLAASSAPSAGTADYAPPAMHMTVFAEDKTVLVCGCCSEEELTRLLLPAEAEAELIKTKKRWHKLLSGLSCATGYEPLDAYMNHWAAYQAIACRLWGRSSLYQSGGAYGFRDQLQDGVNLMLLDPGFARDRIADCCRHQYIEGDVMHWWHAHPEGDKGVRTRCSDDLLWLCWAVCEYWDATGDREFLLSELSYISSPPLKADERDRYEIPRRSDAMASVLKHAQAALDRCAARGFGGRGLPFFGSGDWNDGLDAVDGESVWLGWFFSDCCHRFSALMDALSIPGAQRYRELGESVGAAAEKSFDGEKYPRGFLPDGAPLGGEARIDSLPQSFAALSPYSAPEHSRRAVETAISRLVDRDAALVRLFDPPYSPQERYVGYISSYGAGFRENGGQYTHGALWLAMSCFRLGMAERGYELLRLLLPQSRELRRYQAEPFVLAADVYSAPGHEGEAGWTWYTGSAGWFFRVVTQELFGLQLKAGKLYISPCLPPSLPGYICSWRDGAGAEHEIRVENGAVRVDGSEYKGEGVG